MTWEPGRRSRKLPAVSGPPVDEYLRAVEEPQRGTLELLQRTVLTIVPDAEQAISYCVPASRVPGQTIAGFAGFKGHLSYLPISLRATR
jgi:uncharacterized protein YdhG (YjbR/CyaY superfamily)